MNFQLFAPPPPMHHQPHGWEVPQMQMPAFNMDMQMPNLDSLFDFSAPQQQQEAKPACEIDEADNMDVLEFERQLFRGLYKSSVKGFYRSSIDIISDECMGDWMNDSFTGLYAVMEKFQNDPFSISLVEAKKVMDDLIDMKYKNLEACQVEHVTDSMKHWCLDNYDVCMGNDDLLARIIPHGMDIISVVYEYFNVLMEDDSCATAQEQID